jgi:hypothetical protein
MKVSATGELTATRMFVKRMQAMVMYLRNTREQIAASVLEKSIFCVRRQMVKGRDFTNRPRSRSAEHEIPEICGAQQRRVIGGWQELMIPSTLRLGRPRRTASCGQVGYCGATQRQRFLPDLMIGHLSRSQWLGSTQRAQVSKARKCRHTSV